MVDYMQKRMILIVDDQAINRKILGRLLEDEYEIIFAKDGKEAMECMRQHGDIISAIILDIIMPVMNGYDVLREMRKDTGLSKIPVIVSSQKDNDEDEIKALALGAQDYVIKPYKADIIRHRLKNIIKFRETAAIVNKTQRDELTGLYNKQFFLQRVEQELRDNPERRYDLFSIGIERFKLINDTYGIHQGDKVLQHIAGLMQEVNSKVGICGRFSSDSFFMLYEHQEQYSNEDFKIWFDRVNEFPIEMDIKIHCGIYMIHNDKIPIIAMCDRAQLAADKNRGKYDEHFYIYDESLREKLLEEQYIISNMQAALKEKQFHVYYQPKYDLNTEMIVGAEALVRWIHPEKGFVSPGAFIPVFEKNGFVTQMDEYVWETACRDIRRWIDNGYSPIAISVNVSRADIYNPKLTDTLLNLVAKYKIPMRYLHLEITESAYTENPEQIITVVGRLRELGFRIEMDDFGSGYSSLNMLADMPVDVLKLDMGFIQSETKKTSGKGILSFVISLAKWLNLAVVAEGVETKDQILALRSMDCNYVQGFYYAKPMDSENFEELIQHTKTSEMVCTSQTGTEYITERKREDTLADGRVMLVVDDIEINRAALAATFMEDYVIQESENGKEAWEYLQDNYEKVDIIMLDLLMPVMDGFQLLQRIKDWDKTKGIPVIITSQGDSDTEHRSLEMRADDFISKPYNADIIRHRVANVAANYELKKIKNGLSNVERKENSGSIDTRMSMDKKIQHMLESLKAHFDIVRLVDPRYTIVYEKDEADSCDMHSCFSVWGKTARCNNCISMQAYERRTRLCKLEYSEDGLFFVISEYVPYGKCGAVIEMVTKLEDGYVDNVLDKELLYMNLDDINQKSEIDELTGVYNRRHLDHYLAKYMMNTRKKNKDIGIAMVDIDYFKNLNDTYGHLEGDEVLKTVAKLLERNIAISKGDFVSRFGGDEFLIVCQDITPEVFARRIVAVAQLVRHITIQDGNQVEVGISAGCVNFSEFPELETQELIRKADDYLYQAKEAGRNCVCATSKIIKISEE
ncbi:MAG: EAL domain-containing protein [Lachnospiraceae bacterium]|nr:EAL domain-containing protein [Lachnospiraceae bacterium]